MRMTRYPAAVAKRFQSMTGATRAVLATGALVALTACATTMPQVAGYEAGDTMRFRAKLVVEKTEQAKICDQVRGGAITVAQCKERTLAVLEILPKFTHLPTMQLTMLVAGSLGEGDIVQYKLNSMLFEMNGPEPEYQGVICRSEDKACLDDPKRGTTGKVNQATRVAAGI